jgi:hypothetical protein
MRIYFDYHETDDDSASIYDMTFNEVKGLISDFNECMEVDYYERNREAPSFLVDRMQSYNNVVRHKHIKRTTRKTKQENMG